MAELRNIRNTGVVVGGDVTRSTISVARTGSANGGVDEAEVLGQLDTLLNDLLAGVGQLSAERAGDGRIRALLSGLTRAVATVAPLAEVVTDITELVGRLPH
jgi:hypothetical protein